ncbi:MAG: histidinol dehydrogenase [Gammaproteobacteria bacterium]|nr:histidinol dehydrogenase [Gammaproteobacteria bacterium]
MTAVNIRMLRSADADFRAALARLLDRAQSAAAEVEPQVRAIIDAVRARGDAALLDYTARFDRFQPASAAALELPRTRLKAAAAAIPAVQREALTDAAERIRAYHARQKLESWSYTEADGTRLGQQVTALDRVGLYVPGGKAAYPSSVLMNAIPAKLAGVAELVMVVPTPDGDVSELVLAAAHIAGVDRVFTIGGAQAVAALAYGTATVPRVDKIVGPGNIYVATAKRLVFGQVAIDMIAGPSEVVVVADAGADPEWVAMDLFSQAEHDEQAQAILISPDEAFLAKVRAAIERLLDGMERSAVIRASLEGRGALISVPDMDAALTLVNEIAPEHLELAVENPEKLLARVRHAGAVFLGRYSAETLGDYCAGPNHVLPTSGTARFSSPLGVYDFQKRTSLIQCSAPGAQALAKIASVLANGEGLTAHARAAEYRIKK